MLKIFGTWKELEERFEKVIFVVVVLCECRKFTSFIARLRVDPQGSKINIQFCLNIYLRNKIF